MQQLLLHNGPKVCLSLPASSAENFNSRLRIIWPLSGLRLSSISYSAIKISGFPGIEFS